MAETYDHDGKAVKHGRNRIQGIRIHYITAGKGEPLLLLHGTPKSSYYWYRIMPMLTEHFKAVAPDLRGFGYTDKPPTTDGYDCQTAADDVAELMSQLGHEKFHVHGEDCGVEYAYALAALHRDRVKTLSFCEMLLSGFGLEESAAWNPSQVSAQYEQRGVWCWHLPFFYIPHVPEMLIQGHEREFWEFFIKQECYNPTTLDTHALDEWIGCVNSPGGLRGILETYRAGFKNGEINKKLAEKRLDLPILTIGAPEFFGPTVEEEMLKVANSVERAEIFEECGHSLALEKPERLAKILREFMLERQK